MIYIVDYGLGNLASIKNMFKHIDIRDVIITSDKKELEKAEKIILPGVGAFDNGMQHLQKYDLIDILNKKALEDKIPFLGICLGMQLMTNGSEEGIEKGLGWFDADTLRFNLPDDYKVPHMGWNYVKAVKNSEQFLIRNINYRFYFVHSYYVHSNCPEDILFETNYGSNFHSAIQKENLIGMQFHPEKSLKFGMDILDQFSKL
jgi:imidazole glycerol-phosphate synthase subunit HisH